MTGLKTIANNLQGLLHGQDYEHGRTRIGGFPMSLRQGRNEPIGEYHK